MTSNSTEYAKKCATEMVVTAICHLQEQQGSSLKDIVSFLGSAYDIDEQELMRPVMIALKRGMAFGFLKRENGHYKMDVDGFEDDGSTYAREHKRRRSKSGKSKKGGKKGGKKRRRRRH